MWQNIQSFFSFKYASHQTPPKLLSRKKRHQCHTTVLLPWKELCVPCQCKSTFYSNEVFKTGKNIFNSKMYLEIFIHPRRIFCADYLFFFSWQHYLKVHSEKRFSCESCNKAFATQELLRYHLQVCGIKFTCSCGNSYSSYEALLTHSKRKQHTFDDKFKSGNK